MAALLCISEHLGSGLEQENMFPETDYVGWKGKKNFVPDSFKSGNICAKIVIQQIFKNLVFVVKTPTMFVSKISLTLTCVLKCSHEWN